ncbi:MAG: hypothetical protein AABX28_02560 [Nanoarchaeota archaeon]
MLIEINLELEGSDNASHSKQGIFILENNNTQDKYFEEINFLDIAPTILKELKVEIPDDLRGRVIN